MKVSVSWLKEWVNTIPSDIAARLTMAGLEVEEDVTAAPMFTNVVIGEVMELAPHPDADKLQVAQVNIGEKELVQIVCGAPNVAVGIKVPTAIIGAVLPGDFKIKATKLRGVPSNGMLCSAKELGLNDDHGGLMILDSQFEVGADFRELYDLDDQVLDVDLTPNRGDCLSIIGVARDIAAITGQTLHVKEFPAQTVSIDDQKNIQIDDLESCPRYFGRVIKNVDPTAKTPLWMSERLRRCGIRPHGILVDITNYILLELGQPLHAFDFDKVDGDIVVRKAKQGETLTLINEEQAKLSADTLVIADSKDVLAMAGIMGGAGSACDEQTTAIFLESAWFNPLAIAGKARNYGLHTDASHRYERGVDFNLAKAALERATELFITLANGQAGPITYAGDDALLPTRDSIFVRFNRINQLIGQEFAKDDVVNFLTRVGQVEEVTEKGTSFIPPSYRFDLEVEEDLIEEVVRLNGYENVPVSFETTSTMRMSPVKESEVSLKDFNQLLVARDYHEVITMSFVSPKWQEILAPEKTPIALLNPISTDLSVMRTTLLAGVLGAVEYNLKRQQTRLRFFESGLTYNGTLDDLVQERYLAGAICGELVSAQWGESSRKVDFFDIKGDVESLLQRTGINSYTFEAADISILHPGQSAVIKNDAGRQIGYLGKLHPTVSTQLDLNTDVFVFELNFELLKRSNTPVFKELSRFPTSRRDLSLVVPREIQTDQIVNCMLGNNRSLLHKVNLFDIYGDSEKQEDSVKYMAFSLTFQNSKENLKDSEIDTIITSIVNDLSNLGISLRK